MSIKTVNLMSFLANLKKKSVIILDNFHKLESAGWCPSSMIYKMTNTPAKRLIQRQRGELPDVVDDMTCKPGKWRRSSLQS